ncbi:MAG: UDP-N-acetylmuramoyl-tripeptide--D-alanyl-D-alanine ligase [Gallionella sp.]
MMTLSKTIDVLHAQPVSDAMNTRFTAVTTDTRQLKQGDLYIALAGEHFDGADFVAQALAGGAIAALMNAHSYEARKAQLNPQFPLFLVDDTRIALGQLAAYWRRQFDIPMVAITGSNGKTTTKEILASILRAASGSDDAVLATEGNLNNEIGLPLTLLKLNKQHRYAVIEMGMNHAGEIDYLSRIACPQIALINNASDAHLEGMGSVAAVALAKGEIFAGLSQEGSAIINADDAHAPLWRTLAGAHSLLEFGLNSTTDICGTWRPQASGLQLNAQTPSGNFTADLQVSGEHNARNALAATAAAIALNLSLESIVAGLEKFSGVSARLEHKTGRLGIRIIDDTYNANPASLQAAIDVLAVTEGHKVLVLGDMGELGEHAAALHAGIGNTAKQAGIDKLYTLGKLSRNTAQQFGRDAYHYSNMAALLGDLEKELSENTTVLVKGSRFMKMERVVKYLEKGPLKPKNKRPHSPLTTHASAEV